MNLFGRGRKADPAPDQATADAKALERYQYMLRTAPPEDIERAHEEAFASLTPEQRRQALAALAQYVPATELRGDDPASLARAATRAEVRSPGTIERAWGQGGASFGLGSFFLTTLAASFIGTAIAQSFFDSDAGGDGDAGSDGDTDTGDAGAETADAGDTGDAGDLGGGDLGGGDWGGGDFGGGDFGGF